MKGKTMLVMVLAVGLLATGCQGDNADTEVGEETSVAKEEVIETSQEENIEVDEEEGMTLSDWQGDWVSLVSYIDNEELSEEFQTEAKEHGETLEEFKAQWAQGMKTDYLAIEIEGNMAKFYSDEEKNELKFESEYIFDRETEDDHDNDHEHWAVFNATGEGAEYPVLLMMEVHGEDKLAHFHMKYGDTVEDALANENWLPIIIKADSNISQVKQIVGH